MQDQVIETYQVTMEDDKLEIKPEVLAGMYSVIDTTARKLAPQQIRSELVICQENKKTNFFIQVSNRMAPHLISAIQQQADMQKAIGLKSYFYKLQEQIMSQMFAGVKDVIG